MKNNENKNSQIKFRLARVLGLSDATLIGVGALIGGGIFTLTGLALSYAGPSLILVVLLNGFIAFMTAMAYAELGSSFPEAGGAFIWVRKGLGNMAGHMAGWISWFANAVACGLYSLSFAFYFSFMLFSVILPFFGIFFSFNEGSLFQKIIAIAVILCVGWINYKGVAGASRFGKIIVYLELLILGIFILFGLLSFFKKPELATTFIPFLPMGIFGLFSAMGLMYIGFEGSEIIVQSGEELKNPRKNIPRAIFFSLGIICILYLLIIFSALAGGPGWQVLAQAGQGALVRASSFFMPGLSWVIIFGGLLAASAALNATIFSSSHVSFSMGRAGTLPSFLAKIHARNRTPYVAIIVSTILVILVAGFLPLKEVAAVTDLLFVFLFIQLHLALIALRKKHPDIPRPYKMPFYPLPSLLAIGAYGILIYQFLHISPVGLAIVLFWLLTGFLVYFSYSKPVEIEKVGREIFFEETFRTTERKADRILLPIRSDTNWRDLLNLALIFAKEKDAEMFILSVKKVPLLQPLRVAEDEIEEDKRFLEEALDLCKDCGVNTHAVLMTSHSVSRAIMSMVQREKPSLLLMGWKGYARLTKSGQKVFGRKLDIILREVNCDLIITRIKHLNDLKDILLPCTAGFHLHMLGQTAKVIAEAFDSKIKAIFVTTKNDAKKSDPEEELNKCVSSMEIPSQISLKNQILYVGQSSPRDIAFQIVQESQNHSCILMASARMRLFREMIFGNVPEIVARNSTCSLIIVKSHRTILQPILAFIYSKLS